MRVKPQRLYFLDGTNNCGFCDHTSISNLHLMVIVEAFYFVDKDI